MIRSALTRHVRPLCAGLLLVVTVCARVAAQSAAVDPLAILERGVASAEASLRDGEMQVAESRYRTVLRDGWMLIGSIEAAAGRLPDARDAFTRASMSAVDQKDAQQSLAMVLMQMGDPGAASAILRRLVPTAPADTRVRRLLAEALVSAGEIQQAVQELEEAHTAAPSDSELAYTLASAYLRVKKVDAAERLFTEVVKRRPIAATHVLIGRTYRDFADYDRARAELMTALKLDPGVRRAHYYLGTVLLLDVRSKGLTGAIEEFQKELKIAPSDPAATLRLGIALVEAKRYAEALAPLQRAAAGADPPVDALHYLGRCLIALDRPAEGIATLQRALERSQGPDAIGPRSGSIHYQLGVALRALGSPEAAAHFEEAQRLSAERAETDRERLARYLADAPSPDAITSSTQLPGSAPAESLRPETARRIEDGSRAVLTRAYLNLGVMQAQQQHFTRAAEYFEQASGVAPDFPRVQYSLGVAYFNAQQFDKAAGPLQRALAQDPSAKDVRRMLAITWLNTGVYDKAAALLADDPAREGDPSLQYAYGLALVRSDRAAEGERVFSQLLARHGDTPELHVVLGQAHAQQGEFEDAIASLQRALQLKADVPEANTTLGIIFLKEGRLSEAETALRTELKNRPGDLTARHTLAAVLDLETRPEEAIVELRRVLAAKPEFADARYLLGKILLAQGQAQEAVEHLEAGVRIAPGDANIHFQLAQAYQKLGRAELAQKELEVYRQLKDKRRAP